MFLFVSSITHALKNCLELTILNSSLLDKDIKNKDDVTRTAHYCHVPCRCLSYNNSDYVQRKNPRRLIYKLVTNILLLYINCGRDCLRKKKLLSIFRNDSARFCYGFLERSFGGFTSEGAAKKAVKTW